MLVIAPFIMARRLRRAPGWADLATPSGVVDVLLVARSVAYLLAQTAGWAGLFQRLMALIAPAWAATLAVRLLSVEWGGESAPASRP